MKMQLISSEEKIVTTSDRKQEIKSRQIYLLRIEILVVQYLKFYILYND